MNRRPNAQSPAAQSPAAPEIALGHSALQAAFSDHGPFLRRLARALTRDEHAAEDLVQDTWMAALRQSSDAIRSRAWLATVLRRGAFSRQRRSRHLRSTDQPIEPAETAPGADDIASTLERERLLQAAIERLEEPFRTAMFLRYHEALPPRAIAARLDVPVKTVNSRLARGRAAMREDLDRRFADERDPRGAWMAALAPLATGKDAAIRAATGLGTVITWTAAAAAIVAVVWLGVVRPRLSAPAGEDANLALSSAGAGPAASTDSAPNATELDLPSATQEQTTRQRVAATSGNSATLRVLVENSSGEPVEGHIVLLSGPVKTTLRRDATRRDTGDDGRVSFEGLAPGRYFLRDLQRLATSRVEIAPDADTSHTLTLAEGFTVRGRVVLPGGAPASGARIWAGGSNVNLPLLLALAEADEAGRFSLTTGEDVWIQAALPDRLPSQAFRSAGIPEVATGVREIELTVGEIGSRLAGRVVDGDGRPVEGAAVAAGRSGGSFRADDEGAFPHPVVVMTDEEGRFEYGHALAEDAIRITAYARGYAASRASIASSAAGSVELVLGEGAQVAGTVTRPDGTPAVGASVLLQDPVDHRRRPSLVPMHTAVTDESGRFTFARVGEGPQRIEARSKWEEPLARGRAEIDVVAGESQELEIRLSDGPSIAGRVLDGEGLPVEGIRVGAKTWIGQSHEKSVTTDAHGRFRLTCLESDPLMPGNWEVEAVVLDGHSMLTLASVTDVVAGVDDVVLTIERPRRASAFITGRIRAGSGSGRIPADIEFLVGAEGDRVGLFLHPDRDTGRFRIGPLVPGRYRIEGMRQRQTILTRSGIEVKDGETIDVGDLVIAGGGRVEVTGEFARPLGLPAEAEAALLRDSRLKLTRGDREVELEREGERWVSAGFLEPGEWKLSRAGGQLVFPTTEVSVVAGETSHVAIVLGLPDDTQGAIEVMVER